MKFGVVFPQTEFPADPTAIRDYAQAVEGLGFSHVLAYDHVLGANPDRPGGWQGPYTYRHPFIEPFLLFSYMTAAAQKLGFVTGVIILPQRETALVAKQAATLDVLCAGRLRLGIGTGWNKVEYTALNQDFHNRGRRQEEQIEVMRRLWTQELVTYQGEWHSIEDAGLNPLPVQQPIPIWLGGYADAVIRRIARLGDGWLPGHYRVEKAQADLDKLEKYLQEAGRPRQAVGIEPRLHSSRLDPQALAQAAAEWKDAGATHLSINTMGNNFTQVSQHIEDLTAAARALGLE